MSEQQQLQQQGRLGKELLESRPSFVPPLDWGQHKGQLGRIGVVGGSREYTGAPFFAGLSALRAGADICHVFCTLSAATPIKCYSPELIVHPCLVDSVEAASLPESQTTAEAVAEAVIKWASTCDCIVVGPGLGRDDMVMEQASLVIQRLRERSIPVVIDGDGLWIVTHNPGIIRGGESHTVLTPNVVEYHRLARAMKLREDCSASQLATALNNCTVLQKKGTDVITDGLSEVSCSQTGAPRRCGGQGDVLGGVCAVFLAWAHGWSKRTGMSSVGMIAPTIQAAYCASRLVRCAASRAFARERRGMSALHVANEVSTAFEELFGGDSPPTPTLGASSAAATSSIKPSLSQDFSSSRNTTFTPPLLSNSQGSPSSARPSYPDSRQ